MRKQLQKRISLLLAAGMALGGCSSDQNRISAETAAPFKEHETAAKGIRFEYQVNPETFELSFQTDGRTIPVAGGSSTYAVTDYSEENGATTWRYPAEDIQISLVPVSDPLADYLSVTITSETEGDNSFSWPDISAKQYYLPFGEGKRVPADASEWKEYLNGQQFSVLEQLSMPFWISSAGDYNLLFIMEDPFHTQMAFQTDPELSFSITREYPAIDNERSSSFRIYLTDRDPVSAAKLYRDYRMEAGQFVTLEQKAEQNPNIRKLYGAPFIYLWGDFIVSGQDIDWTAFRRSMDAPVIQYLLGFYDSVENGNEFLDALTEIKTQDYVAEYQKNIICSYLSQLLKLHDFWNPEVFTATDSSLDLLLQKGYENLNDSERIQANKYALAANMPGVFHDADTWMDASTVDILEDMKENGIEQAWIGLNSWEQAYAKPELLTQAGQLGYLMASYDSYHSIHEPGREQWITAKFDDPSLYEAASITDKNGQKIRGFQNVGRKLNPAFSMPSVQSRMTQIMSNKLPFTSWFIDCDATGEIYDDYTSEHITTQKEDLVARMERMSYIRDQHRLVIGSEGGNDFAASTVAFAHGLELKSFSWMDSDMKENRDSEYYIGKYYNPNGGVAEHFSKRIPVKDQYYAVFADPRYDIPLFKLVYNDSVITSYHWDWSTFKIQGATQERMIREVLYNVPPLYHLDSEEWAKYKQDIIRHQSVWSSFSRKAVTEEMTGFSYLTDDGTVQKTDYGSTLTAIANFSDTPYSFESLEIPPHSVWIGENGQGTIYTPELSESSR